MSLHGLRIGVSGLAAAQRAMETAANNLANVNTEGFSRQRVELSTASAIEGHRGLLGPGSTGMGVAIDGITRAHDALASQNLSEQSATAASWDTRAQFTARTEGILGPLERGTASALTSFWNAWESLSTEPESATARAMVIEAGRRVATSLNDASTRLDGIRRDLVADIDSTVARINMLSSQLATLNQHVQAATVAGNSASQLLDQRELVARELAELAGATVIRTDDGDLRISVGAMPLVDGNRATPMTATSPPPQATWPDGRPVAAAGRLGALVEAASAGVDELSARVDEIAMELRDLVNDAHADGYGLDGVTGREFFSGTGAADLAVRSDLTATMVAASAGGLAADGNHALVLGALRTAASSSGATIDELVGGLQGRLGLQAADALGQQRLSAAVVSELETQLATTTGVSTDEELADMLRFQRAYDASARVITVLDQMLDRLINGTAAP